jgi:translocation and assembly module TamB
MTLVGGAKTPAKKHLTLPSLLSKVGTGLVKLWLTLMIVICFLIGFILTPWGTKVLVSSASSLVDGLTIDYQRGGLGSELLLSSLTWDKPTGKVDIDNLRVSIQLSCVWRFALCVDSVSSDKLEVQIQPVGDPSPKTEAITAAMTLPIPVSIQNISLNKFSLKVIDTIDVTWQKLTAKLDFYQRLRVEKMQLDGFTLTTYATAKPQLATLAEPFDWTKWQYQPISPLPIVLPIHFDVLAFNVSTASLQIAGQEQTKLKRVRVKVKGSDKKLQLDELFIEHELGQLSAQGNVLLNGQLEHTFSVDADAQWVQQTSLKPAPIRHTPLKLTFRSSGNINSLSTQIELMETTSSKNLNAVTAQTKPLKLALDFSSQPSKVDLPVKIRLDWSDFKWPLTEPQIKSESGVIAISGDLKALKMSVKTLLAGKNVPDTQINLSAVAASTAHNKSVVLNEFLLETLGGQVLSQGKLSFSDYIDWQGNATINHLDPSVFWPELAADINGVVATQANNKQGSWQAKLSQLDINGQWQGYPLSASGHVDFHQDNGLQLRALTIKNADNSLLLNGNVSSQKLLDIDFLLDVADLSNSLPQMSGVLNLVGSLTGSAEQPEVIYELSGSNLLVANIFVEQAKGKGNVKWNEHKPVDLSLNLTGIQGVNNQVDSAQILLSGDASNHMLDLTTNGQTTSMSASVQGKLNQSSWQGTWLSGDIISTYAHLSLLESFKIGADWAQQQYFVAPHCWRHSDNELCIKQAEFKQNTARWDVSLREFDVLSVLGRLVPGIPNIQTNSRLNLDMSGDWDIQQLPNANLIASLSPGNWVFNEQNKLQLRLDETLLEATITQNNILAKINLSGSEIGSLSASLQGQSGMYADPLTRPIQGELLIERFELAAFKALLPQLDVLLGDINGEAQINGTIGVPLLTGELKLANGAFKDELLPVALSAIEQSISLKGQSAEFKGSYQLGEGLGNINGDITWMPTLKGNLHISGEELEFDYQNILKAKVSPSINIMFEPKNLMIQGDVTIPYARVKVRALPKGAISPSKDVILVEKQAELQVSQQRLALNVLLKVDPLRSNEVKLDAFGLTTDLQGELRLQNLKSEIFGSGVMQLVNGRYRAYGQNLIVREGDILFTSSLDRPFLSIEAVRDPDLTSDSVIAGLRIEGAAQNPSVSVFSEPVMEQQQILSYMLTGRGLGESSGDSHENILAYALLSLGLGQSENLISKVGDKLGFEDVNLDTSGQDGDTQLLLTGTIAPGVQLRYGVGVFDSISEVAIRYELIPKLYIEAVNGGTNTIDIYYQFSIEGSQNKRTQNE